MFSGRLAVLWVLLVGLLACAPEHEPQVRRLDQAQFVMRETHTPPTDETPRIAVRLPNRWSQRQPDAHGSGWYRFVVPPIAAGDRWALLITDVNMNAEVFVDGRWVGSGGSFDEPVSQHWNRPLLFPIDPALLKSGATIDVRVYAYAGDWGGLGPPLLGPFQPLRRAYDERLAVQVIPAQIASVVSALLAALFFALWLTMGRRTLYGYFAIASACYFVHNLSGHLRDIVVPFWFGRWAINIALDWYAVWQLFAFHRWLRIERPWMERALLAAIAIGSVVLLIGSPPIGSPRFFLPAALTMHVFAVLPLPYALWMMWRHRERASRFEAHIVLSGSVVLAAVVTHALLMHLGWLPQSAPRVLYAIGPILLTCFGAIMLVDFLRTFRTAERLNVELDQRVRAAEEELAENYDRLRKLEGEQLLARERERIMREMHDGMGNSLVSTLSLVERQVADKNQIANALRDALIDMRVVVDSLDPSTSDVATLLGMLRSRLEPRLSRGSLAIRWRVTDVPEPQGWGPEAMLHVMRIVQEAITNIIKHADATELTVETSTNANAVLIRVHDNGTGGVQEGEGRGLRNMRYRAAQLEGTLDIDSTPTGTTLTLTLPR